MEKKLALAAIGVSAYITTVTLVAAHKIAKLYEESVAETALALRIIVDLSDVIDPNVDPQKLDEITTDIRFLQAVI